jgi:hypothetical protein
MPKSILSSPIGCDEASVPLISQEVDEEASQSLGLRRIYTVATTLVQRRQVTLVRDLLEIVGVGNLVRHRLIQEDDILPTIGGVCDCSVAADRTYRARTPPAGRITGKGANQDGFSFAQAMLYEKKIP